MELVETPSSPSSPTIAGDDYSADDLDADLSTPSPTTRLNDEEFIATLFPHPLPRIRPVNPPLGRCLLSANSHLQTEEDKSLFNHYVHVVSRALCRSGDTERNPFLITLLPLAAQSAAVTSVILSLSGCHWKRVYPDIWGRALKRQGQGIAILPAYRATLLTMTSNHSGERATRELRYPICL